MSELKLNDRVLCKATKDTGVVIGWFAQEFAIILLDTPNPFGHTGKVIHITDLEKEVARTIEDANQRVETV